ncbi:MAG: hypothetical protein ACUVTY_11510, partial [Armatimonadota bacterium]
HVFAFLVALVVWVMGNAVVTVYQAKAQDVGAGMATGLPFQRCSERAEDYFSDMVDNCALIQDHCVGGCWRKKFTTRRCKWVFELSSCTEPAVPQQYVMQEASCVLRLHSCSCNDDWHDTNVTGWASTLVAIRERLTRSRGVSMPRLKQYT